MVSFRSFAFMLFLTVFFSAACYAQGKNDYIMNQDARIISKESVQGTWKFIEAVEPAKKDIPQKVELPEIPPGVITAEPDDAYKLKPEVTAGSENSGLLLLFFRSDTLWELDYPCTLFAAHRYSIKTDSLKIQYYPDVESRLKLFFKNDTLCMSGDPEYGISKFIRTRPNRDTMQLLLSDSINPACLTGEWKWHTYSDEPLPPLKVGTDIPFEPVYDLVIAKKNLPTAMHIRTLTFTIAGKKRVFKYRYLADETLQLSLMNWKKADGTPLILYYKKR